MFASSRFVNPALRDAQYGSNVARYLCDMHDGKQVFNFCGCLLFQLCLSDKLREHLSKIAADERAEQPMIYDASKARMAQIPGYTRNANADNLTVFHGREVRDSSGAAGGQGCVLHLSLASNDPEGWTDAELKDYDGWGHDSRRHWRQGLQYEEEGFKTYRAKFGPAAHGLQHRFYLHYDSKGAMWLAAEDGCEGEPWGQ